MRGTSSELLVAWMLTADGCLTLQDFAFITLPQPQPHMSASMTYFQPQLYRLPDWTHTDRVDRGPGDYVVSFAASPPVVAKLNSSDVSRDVPVSNPEQKAGWDAPYRACASGFFHNLT
jgi:hypothetical protein